MEEPTAEAFADWLHPSDVVNHFYQQGLGDDEAQARTLAMLSDGLLRAAAGQLIVNGRDLGLALIPRDTWPVAGRSDVWSTGRFRFSGQREDGKAWSISAYDVRIDRDYQILPSRVPPPPQPTAHPANRPPLPDARLTEWGRLFFAENPDATEAQAREVISTTFPGRSVSRERLRRIMPSRRRGRPLKSQD